MAAQTQLIAELGARLASGLSGSAGGPADPAPEAHEDMDTGDEVQSALGDRHLRAHVASNISGHTPRTKKLMSSLARCKVRAAKLDQHVKDIKKGLLPTQKAAHKLPFVAP